MCFLLLWFRLKLEAEVIEVIQVVRDNNPKRHLPPSKGKDVPVVFMPRNFVTESWLNWRIMCPGLVSEMIQHGILESSSAQHLNIARTSRNRTLPFQRNILTKSKIYRASAICHNCWSTFNPHSEDIIVMENVLLYVYVSTYLCMQLHMYPVYMWPFI